MCPRQILELGKQFNLMIRLQNILKASLQDVLKMSWRRFCRRLEDVLKTSWQDVLKMSSKGLEDVLKVFLQDVLKTSWKRLENVLKTYGQDEYIGLDQDVWKTSWRRLLKMNDWGEYIRLDQDVFWRRRRKTSSRRLHQDECLLGMFYFSPLM